MPTTVKKLLLQFLNDLQIILGDSISKSLVYGSYARGDYSEFSDVDLMILVTLSEKEIHQKRNAVYDLAFDYFMQYGIDISPIVKNIHHFKEWSEVSDFYKNVLREGITL